MFKIIYFLFLLLVSVSCSRLVNPETADVMLSASVENISVISKVPGTKADFDDPETVFRGAEPSLKHPLAVDIWFSETSGEYIDNPQGLTSMPCKTTITYTSSSPDYPNPVIDNTRIKYSRELVGEGDAKDYKPAYCIGFYPQNKWNVANDGKTASAVIDGKTDLMFAPQIEGNWTNLFGSQIYSHFTTWLKVCVSATTPDAISAWGAIKKISVIDHSQYKLYNSIVLNDLMDVTDGSMSYEQEGTDISFDVVPNNTGNLALQTVIKEYGYAMCSPSEKYNLRIETADGKIKDILIDLKDIQGNAIASADDARGKMFVITLYFNPFNVVEGVCTLNSWNNENENLELQ